MQDLVFGNGGNAAEALLDGWSHPEDGFVWSTGQISRVRLRADRAVSGLVLEITVTPLLFAATLVRQRLRVLANGVTVFEGSVDGETIFAAALTDVADAAEGDLCVTLCHPDAACPATLGMNGDRRVLGVMVHRMRLFELSPPMAPAARFLPRTLAPFRPTQPDAPDAGVKARTGLPLNDLLSQFESLGHNCEFGLMQRTLGAEPLGLLRFGGVRPARLLDGLEAGFAGIADAAGMSVMTGQVNGREEYLIRDGRYAVELHTNQFGGGVSADALIAKMVPHLTYLQRLFAETLADGSRLFVLHHPRVHDAARAMPYLAQLRGHGPNMLLYVTAHPTVPPGTVVQEHAHLLHGYTDVLPPMHEGDRVNIAAWVSLCVNAYDLWRGVRNDDGRV